MQGQREKQGRSDPGQPPRDVSGGSHPCGAREGHTATWHTHPSLALLTLSSCSSPHPSPSPPRHSAARSRRRLCTIQHCDRPRARTTQHALLFPLHRLCTPQHSHLSAAIAAVPASPPLLLQPPPNHRHPRAHAHTPLRTPQHWHLSPPSTTTTTAPPSLCTASQPPPSHPTPPHPP